MDNVPPEPGMSHHMVKLWQTKKNAIKPQTCKLLVKMEFMPRMTAKGEVGTLTRQVGIKQNVLIEHNASTMNYFVLRCAFCALKASL